MVLSTEVVEEVSEMSWVELVALRAKQCVLREMGLKKRYDDARSELVEVDDGCRGHGNGNGWWLGQIDG